MPALSEPVEETFTKRGLRKPTPFRSLMMDPTNARFLKLLRMQEAKVHSQHINLIKFIKEAS